MKKSMCLLALSALVGLPASWYERGGRLEIYHRAATIVIHGNDPARIERFATSLVLAPDVLTELAAYGFGFEEDCADDRHYCEARG